MKLKSKRQEKGFTQYEIANKANMSEKQYRRVEHGEQDPSIKKALLIAQVLGTTVEEIFTTN